jgi:hypothetical protein
VFDDCENIDARLFTGFPSEEELGILEEMLPRWQERVKDLKNLHDELAVEEMMR